MSEENTSGAPDVSDVERVVLDKLLTHTVVMRDAAARLDQGDQWTRYAHASTVIDEVLANGWEDADAALSPDEAGSS